MFPFQTATGSHFYCRADFTAGPVLNLNFLDAARQTIPFHVSIRQSQSRVVVNRCDTKGWRREIEVPMVLPAGPVDIAIDFTSLRAVLRIDGKTLGRFDFLPRPDRGGRFLLRRGFPSLAKIAFVDVDGPLMPDGMLRHMPFPGPAGVHLNDALEVVLRGLGGDVPPGATLRIDGFAESIPAVLRRLTLVSWPR